MAVVRIPKYVILNTSILERLIGCSRSVPYESSTFNTDWWSEEIIKYLSRMYIDSDFHFCDDTKTYVIPELAESLFLVTDSMPWQDNLRLPNEVEKLVLSRSFANSLEKVQALQVSLIRVKLGVDPIHITDLP